MKSSVKRFERNNPGRDLIVGDIHGHFTKLQAALDAVGFSPDAGDRLFSVGDLVDRGPESHLSLEWLSKPWFHAVAGNHEAAAIMFADGVMPEGYYRGAFAGGWNIDNTQAMRHAYSATFNALPIAIELETDQGLVGIVHADCPRASWQAFIAALEDPETPKQEREHIIDMAQWSRDRADRCDDSTVEGVRAIVVGHTPMQAWTSLGNVIFIDTGAWLPEHRGVRHFTILDAKTLRPAEKPSALDWGST